MDEYDETKNTKKKKKLRRRPRTEDEVGESWIDLGWIIFALILPPIAVLCKRGCCVEFFLTILLTGLMWLPGVTFAWYAIFKEELWGDTSGNNQRETWPNPSATAAQSSLS